MAKGGEEGRAWDVAKGGKERRAWDVAKGGEERRAWDVAKGGEERRETYMPNSALHQGGMPIFGCLLDGCMPPEAMGGIGVRHKDRVVGPRVDHVDGTAQAILWLRTDGVVRAPVAPSTGPLVGYRIELNGGVCLLVAHHCPRGAHRRPSPSWSCAAASAIAVTVAIAVAPAVACAGLPTHAPEYLVTRQEG